MEEGRTRTDYCVYVDVADSFLLVIIKLHIHSIDLPYLKRGHYLAMSIL